MSLLQLQKRKSYKLVFDYQHIAYYVHNIWTLYRHKVRVSPISSKCYKVNNNM